MSDVETIVANLRRSALPGSIGDAIDRAPGVLQDPVMLTEASRFVPSPNPLAVALNGPGFFVLQTSAGRVFTRLGDFRVDDRGLLVDPQGRAVIGYQIRPDGSEGSLTAIAVAATDVASRRFVSYSIDENGVISGIPARNGRRSGVRIARLAIAVFQAPEQLRRVDETTVKSTQASGDPAFVSPGIDGAGPLKPHVLSAGAVDLTSGLHALWMQRRKAELEAAIAGASDSCTRTALGIVR